MNVPFSSAIHGRRRVASACGSTTAVSSVVPARERVTLAANAFGFATTTAGSNSGSSSALSVVVGKYSQPMYERSAAASSHGARHSPVPA